MTVINTNVKALSAQAASSNVDKISTTTMQRLSTGLRINSAKDDAAGLAISNRMTSQIRGYAVAIRNSNDGISMTQTAEGAMGQVTSMLQRMRELSVQAANGAMTSSDRGSLQQEVTQLKSEIQNIATKTNHNNIKLLDGSAGKIQIQTGVNAHDMMTIGFDSLQTKDLGIGNRTTLSSVGGLIDVESNAKIADGDLTLNGVAVGASLATSDLVSSGDNKAASAIAKAAAINKVSEQSGVYATVNKTVAAGQPMAAATAGDTGSVSINGLDTATFYMSGNKEIDRASVTQAINDISDRTGVKAVNTHDDKQGITLVAADGRNIVLGTSTGDAGYDTMGIAAAGDYVGTYELSTKDGSAISIGSAVANAQTGELRSGLHFGSYEAGSAQSVSANRISTHALGGAGTFNGTTLTINGVAIAGAIGSDDAASFEDGKASTKADSAIAIAAAINKATNLTGVTAKAAENVIRGTGFGAAEVTKITLNGIEINTSLKGDSTRDDVLNVINAHKGETGVVATAYGEGIQMVAADGRNISIKLQNSGGGIATGDAIGLKGVALDATDPTSFFAGVSLSSDKAFTLDSGSDGDVSNFKKLGFSQGTFGGAGSGMKVADLDISTTAGAADAINVIDAAIEGVGANQAKAGAYQNRLDAVVSNLTESNQNMSASRSRILDTDYATETTTLARAQIISQAATAMLAQANQSAQSVLSLLK
ncbi:flagellin [Limnohabitans sp.]|uniref:flagellin N-terminal helical domain-containing protein n=1 Tax=Limnohabitans sp. TaxID=1907725 RepID=UPI00286F7C04|nr:flagellin [Limnohabitans sp.]